MPKNKPKSVIDRTVIVSGGKRGRIDAVNGELICVELEPKNGGGGTEWDWVSRHEIDEWEQN